MSDKPLMLKYRPTVFDEVFGNKEIIEALRLKLEEGKTKTFMFKGPRGCGKTTLARIVAKEIGAHDRYIHEKNISDVGLKDFGRYLYKVAPKSPLYGDSKVFIFDECQDASSGFQNTILKLLEEPPKNTYFILCTTNPEKIKKALKSRCMQFEVKTLQKNEMKNLINKVLESEGVKDFPEEATNKIIGFSEGCPREALIKLDSVIDIEDDETLINAITSDSVEESEIKELCQALLKQQSWKTIAKIIKQLDKDPETIRRAILGYMTAVLLNSGKPIAALIIECFKEPYYNTGKAGLVLSCFEAINQD